MSFSNRLPYYVSAISLSVGVWLLYITLQFSPEYYSLVYIDFATLAPTTPGPDDQDNHHY